ncbi:MAG TPA: hypothetical protein VF708_09915 [Pyrinomonadaceae bacterium]|jgi:hypothetical protein
MRFDRAIFFRDYRARFGSLSQTEVDGLNFLLEQIERDEAMTVLRQVAYLLATVKGETGKFQPLKERRANPRRQPALFRQQQRYFPSGFFGRGYVQLTFRENYRNAGQKLAGMVIQVPNGNGSQRTITISRDTFVNEPDLVMQPVVSYLILSRGMLEGWFRKRPNGRPFKLSDFIQEGNPPDYLNARNIINHPSSGARKFAQFAEKFELVLRASRVGS